MTDAPETTANLHTVKYAPSGSEDFMNRFGLVFGFWEGWRDAADRLPFRAEYETASVTWQVKYENARELVEHIRAEGLRVPPWKRRYRPSSGVWDTARIIIGMATSP